MADLVKEYIFNNSTEDLFPLVDNIMSDVSSSVQEIAARISAKAILKQIIIELLTNGIKHSNTSETYLAIRIKGRKMEVIKRDKGREFAVNGYGKWPLDKMYVGEEITVHRSDFSAVTAIVESPNEITFHIEEYPIVKITGESDFNSHYGLLILTKASERFSYSYNVSDHSNNFTLIIPL